MKRIVLLLVLCAATTASADPIVLAVDGKDIFIDLGAKDGVGAGSVVELLHEVVAKDPRTGATLRDRFALGTLTVVKSGDGISVARADGDLAKRILAGDHVRLVSGKRSFIDPWVEQVATSKGAAPPAPPVAPGTATIDHAALARDAWQDTLGHPPEQRIERWQKLVAGDPQTPYRKAIDAEIASLKTQIADRDQALASARSAAQGDRSPRVAHLVGELVPQPTYRRQALLVGDLARAVPGEPIDLAFLARSPAAVGQAWLYVRPEGAAGFTRLELVRDGDAYLRATIDGKLVHGESLQWYVEVAGGGDADAVPVLGSQGAPQLVEIQRVVEEAPIAHGRSHVDAHVDYVDFDGGLNKGYDQYYQAELDFGYRFLDPIYAVRLGFGTLSGFGGPKDVIDADKTGHCLDASGTYKCKRVAFSYVYTEFEYRIRPNVAVMLRPQAGLLTTDLIAGTGPTRCHGSNINGCEFFTGFGGRARLRLGDEQGTNLVLGAGFSQRVGTLLEAAYHWLPAPVVPVQITVQVTDLPVPEDFGVRLIGDVGYRKVAWFYPSLRVSYQARDIDHAGLSGGMAMNFDW